MEQGYTLLGSFKSAFEAHGAAGMLQAQDIPATVVSEGRYAGLAGGYRVKVLIEDVERAQQFLSSATDDIDLDEYVDPDDTSYKRCPKCGVR